jgi:antitoxin CptB
MAAMQSDADLKRLRWRAHHRGIKEADILIGSFFDAHGSSWGEPERQLFAAMLDEQDVDIIAWATGTAQAPERYRGTVLQELQKLNYLPVLK